MSPTNHPKFQGFLHPTTTPVPDEVFDVLMHQLSGAELKVLLYICRRTYGFKRQSDSISLSQMVSGITTKDGRVLDSGTGLTKLSITKAMKVLGGKAMILAERNRSKERGDEPTTYSLNVPHQATTPVPDEVFDVLIHQLSGAELKVLLYICRRTFGFKKNADSIALSQMVSGITTKEGKVLDSGTGLGKATVSRVITALEEKGVIVRNRNRSAEKGDEPTTYSLNMLPVYHFETRGGIKMRHGGVSEKRQGEILKRDTQQTVIQETENNNDDVVQALIIFGISENPAKKFGKQYPEDYLAGKLAWAEWLLNRGEIGGDGRNAAGWLRAAIIGEYKPAADQVSPAQQKAKEEQDQAAIDERDRQQKDYQQAKEAAIKRVKANNPPEPIGEDGLTTESAWNLTLKKLKEKVTPTLYETWLKDTLLLGVTDGTAQVMVANAFAVEYMNRRLYQSISRTLSDVIHQDVEVGFIAADVITGVRVGD